MTQSVEVEIDDREIIDCLRCDPDLILEACKRLSENPGSPATRRMYAEAARLLGADAADLDAMEPAAWAEAYRLADRIGRTQMMDELKRVCPEDFS